MQGQMVCFPPFKFQVFFKCDACVYSNFKVAKEYLICCVLKLEVVFEPTIQAIRFYGREKQS